MDNTRSTSDLYWAAFLLTSGAEIIEERQKGRRTIWVFSGVDLDDLDAAWMSNRAVVLARAYAANILLLKARVNHKEDSR
jgi:hypothetical protein